MTEIRRWRLYLVAEISAVMRAGERGGDNSV